MNETKKMRLVEEVARDFEADEDTVQELFNLYLDTDANDKINAVLD